MPNALFIYVVLCLVVGYLGRKSRLGMVRSLLLSLLLTPLIIFIYLLLFATIDGESRSGTNRPRGN
jgi:hypothetical protein